MIIKQVFQMTRSVALFLCNNWACFTA